MMIRYLDAKLPDSMHIQIRHDTQLLYFFKVRADFDKMYCCLERLYPDISIIEYIEV